jgi:hypothetical protein
MPPRKSSNRFVISIDPSITGELKDREIIFERADGKCEGISRAVNKSLREYLRRI